tara:strand:- start:92 stop:463 length:372 start_codon:yes stop_codon:yes gene_type:complete
LDVGARILWWKDWSQNIESLQASIVAKVEIDLILKLLIKEELGHLILTVVLLLDMIKNQRLRPLKPTSELLIQQGLKHTEKLLKNMLNLCFGMLELQHGQLPLAPFQQLLLWIIFLIGQLHDI